MANPPPPFCRGICATDHHLRPHFPLHMVAENWPIETLDLRPDPRGGSVRLLTLRWNICIETLISKVIIVVSSRDIKNAESIINKEYSRNMNNFNKKKHDNLKLLYRELFQESKAWTHHTFSDASPEVHRKKMTAATRHPPYDPPNQRNCSLNRRKSGGDRLERASNYASDGEKNLISASKSISTVPDAGGVNRGNEYPPTSQIITERHHYHLRTPSLSENDRTPSLSIPPLTVISIQNQLWRNPMLEGLFQI
ncbi:hypothetical protein RND71_021602 [Anisodus tanguticus]|uniref:Uncharacterized protein n=1 Tax=Anisodus tanguticus TaxID=243964 RepID=A0AAE1RYD4_9SOLA|nr:hypothetical protein RND71_021602 [Anisodus tanguticus]